MEGDCIASSGYPGVYPDNDVCQIKVTRTKPKPETLTQIGGFCGSSTNGASLPGVS